MLTRVRTALLAVVVVTGVLLPVTRHAWFAWIAGGGFVLILVLSHPAVVRRLGPRRDQEGPSTQR